MAGPGRRGPDPTPRLPWAPLESWRRRLGMAWLAREIGVTRETVHRWRNAGIPVDQADDVARALAHDPTVTAGWLWPDEART